MRAKRRALSIAGLAAIGLAAAGLALSAASPARAFDVPPFKGNDTGGIIAWELAGRIDARQRAIDHCASYGKLVKPLTAQRYYGGYISFACVWPRPVRTVRLIQLY